MLFLLTPLREGRPAWDRFREPKLRISTHAPAGGATLATMVQAFKQAIFLLTPLREGRRVLRKRGLPLDYFYSRPCGRGDSVETSA